MKKTLCLICLLLSTVVLAQSPASDGQGIDPRLLQQDLELLSNSS
ncbi:hypothetical protein CLV24_1389 [Pontibacter ummariensis]|uniref:Uncharacterized protein n=1 Tax=Pontibacter ummariensis TaxID=1610492 RepID=A0A239LAI0_9BACT|nr:hypothetical protein [Pontibacter ummariensis]PRY03944.1 hypothetical protein CLV24_1389 [Pontibacter ummariensis]SNT27471.1 hypothetical protein SAMN06296052_13824 [Pontibacter ummariensis]